MSSNLNVTSSFPLKKGVEGKIVTVRLLGRVCNLSIKEMAMISK